MSSSPVNYYDCFNGDADGICSLVQLRLANPIDSTLITGIKRDIKLVDRVEAEPGDQVTVLDISMEKNIKPLQALINNGVTVFYADHHRSGDIPNSPYLSSHINTASNTCTALIIDNYLAGKYREWAIVAAFGDNITAVAEELCKQADYTSAQTEQLSNLGIALNYNGYGASLDDLFYHPAELFRLAVKYENPFDFIEQEQKVFKTLTEGYDADLAKGLAAEMIASSDSAKIIKLPNEQWARRISGVLGNELANQSPDLAHAIVSERIDASSGEEKLVYNISIRAPKNNSHGADELAIQFGGGGRKGAAGVDNCSSLMLHRFMPKMLFKWSGMS